MPGVIGDFWIIDGDCGPKQRRLAGVQLPVMTVQAAPILTPARSSGGWLRWVGWVAVLSIASVCVAMFATRDDSEKAYNQATPEATIATARLMVEQGKAARLDRLIYADNEEMRKLLHRSGAMLGNLQKLGDAIQVAFPDEVGKLKAQLDEAAKQGKATSLFGQIAQQVMPQKGKRRNFDEQPGGEMRDAFDNAIKDLFADPYGFLKQSQTRVTTEFLTDDSVSLRWDGKPILPPIGLQMKKSGDDKWYFALPTGFPGAQAVMPRTPDEYGIWGSLVEVVDKMIVDLTADITQKKVTTLDQTAKKAGEKAFIPAAMVVFAYTKALEERKKAGG